MVRPLPTRVQVVGYIDESDPGRAGGFTALSALLDCHIKDPLVVNCVWQNQAEIRWGGLGS